MPLFGVPFFFSSSNMSSVVFMHTDDGFVIAADGRCTSRDYVIDTDEAVKIFEATSSSVCVAYALTGYVSGPSHDLLAAASIQAKSLAAKQFLSGAEYAMKFARELKRYMGELIRDRRLENLSTKRMPGAGNRFARLAVVGTYESTPFWATVDLGVNRDGKLMTFPNCPPSTSPGVAVVEGSDEIRKLIDARDPRFWRKQFTVLNSNRISLEEGVDFCKTFIEVQTTPEARQVDEFCNRIGGHIHVAAVKPSGFRWIIAPASLQAAANHPPKMQ